MTSTLITARPVADVGELLSALRTLDIVIAKAVGLSEITQLRQVEQRMFEKLDATWTQLSKVAVKEAAKLAAQGKSADACAAAVDKVMDGWAAAVTPFFSDGIRSAYRLARIAGWKKATKQTTASLSYDGPVATQKAKSVTVAINPSFDVVDEAAAKALVKHQVFWIGQHYQKHVSDSVAKVAREVMVEAGQNRSTAGSLMAKKAAVQLGIVSIPNGYSGSAKSYFEGLTANATTVARTHGQMRSFIDVGITRYEIVTVGDERMCPVCGHMDGKVFTVGDAANLLDKELKAKAPEDVKRAHPWAKVKTLQAISTPGKKGNGGAALVTAGLHLPPFHFRCRCSVDVSEEAGSFDALKPGETPVKDIPAPEGTPKTAKPTGPVDLPLRQPIPLPAPLHPAEPTKPFSEVALSKALKAGGPRKGWDLAQQQEIRRQLNALGKEYGLHNNDVALKLPNADKFSVNSKLKRMNADAVHGWDGVIQATGDVVKRTQDFLNGKIDFYTASSFKAFVHEMMHGHSPLGSPGAYRGNAAALEEATTELAARVLIDKRYAEAFKKIGLRLVTKSAVYQKFIDSLYQAFHTAQLAAQRAHNPKTAFPKAEETMEFAADAAFEFKRSTVPHHTETDMQMGFALKATNVIPARLLEGLNDADKAKFRETFRTTLVQQLQTTVRR